MISECITTYNMSELCMCIVYEEMRQGRRFVREGDLSEMNLVLSLWIALGIFLSISRGQATLCHSSAHPKILNFSKSDDVISLLCLQQLINQ